MAAVAKWPQCSLGFQCFPHTTASSLGLDLFGEFLDFVAHAAVGSRLTLQKNEAGSTQQVTGAVRKSEESEISLHDLLKLLSNGRSEREA